MALAAAQPKRLGVATKGDQVQGASGARAENMRHDAVGRIERKAVTAGSNHMARLQRWLNSVEGQYQEMNGMCGGTTHPRMTTAPRLILGTRKKAVTAAELNTSLMLRRILLFPSPPRRDGKSTVPDQPVYILCAALQNDSQIQTSA